MPTAAEIPLSEHLRKVPPTVRPTVEAAIRTVKEANPKANEITYRRRPPRSPRPMWKIVRYAVDGENVVGIGTFPSHATVFFYRGRELDDGSGLLQGGGKNLRFITLRAPADAGQPVVKRLVRKAFKLAGTAFGDAEIAGSNSAGASLAGQTNLARDSVRRSARSASASSGVRRTT